MAFDIKYSIQDGFDHIIEEKGNQFTALRKIAWGESDNYRLDLRKWYSTETGETVGKGLSFMTEEGPSELVRVLLRTGHCDTVDALECLKERDDFRSSLNYVLNDKNDEFYDDTAKDLKGDYYDPKELLS
jgi:hypothetical protein